MLIPKDRSSQQSCSFSHVQSGWKTKGEPEKRLARTSKFEADENLSKDQSVKVGATERERQAALGVRQP